MKDSKRTLITIALFLLFLGIYSFLVIRPYENSTFATENDRGVRDDLEGTLDTIITGASHAEYGIFNTRVDAALGTLSYNLSGPWQSSYGTRMLLEKELDRNPIKKVYLVFSEGTFSVTKTTDRATGDIKILPRLDGVSERIDYLIHAAAPTEIPEIYQDMVNRGFTYAKALVTGDKINRVNASRRGFHGTKSKSVKLSKKNAAKKKNSETLDTSVLSYNVENMDKIIELCKSRNVEIQVIVVPVSDRMIWITEGWDTWYDFVKEYCEKHEIPLWDFNLHRDRFSILNDQDCYKDMSHLSYNGAKLFADLLIETIQKAEAGEDITADFYPTYQEMKQDSPYNQ